MNLRCLIVDDEPLARERVRGFLAVEPDVEIVAECAEGAAAVDAIAEHRPDLVFLDVQMPRLNGFEVLESLDEAQLPAVIFTTAHEAHALRAFEFSAVDYLLKPFKQARFHQALARARAQIELRRGGAAADPALAALITQLRASTDGPRILVKSPDRILFVKAAEIDHVQAAGNYVVLHVGMERHIMRETMAAMERRLALAGFMRISRSVIVNLSRIAELQPLAAGEYVVILKSGARLDMACPLRDLQARLGST